MNILRVEKPKSLPEFFNLVDSLRIKSNSPLWYRGSGKHNYKLRPTLYRHRKIKLIKKLIKTEYNLMTRFRQRSMPFHNKPLEDDWETLFLMQHYSIPTRLLDWTESPLIGLYFAVMSAITKLEKGKVKYKYPAAVWVLNPAIWNKHALRNIQIENEILSTNDVQLKSYKPTNNFTGMQNTPIAIYGAHNSARIVAQRGVFVLFGQDIQPMEKQFLSKNFPINSLIKILLNPGIINKMKNSVLENGITESVVFPDLEGLAKEIKRNFNF